MNNRNKFDENQVNEWIKEFNRCYRYSGSYNFGVKRQYSEGDRNNRICRYCGKGKPAVNFKNNAHLVPKFLGNRLVRCYFECDSCNELFGKYEANLSNFIGIRGYLVPSENIGMERQRVYKSQSGNSLLYPSKRGIEISDLKKDILETLPENKGFKCIAKKKPYIPLNVYKSLVKIVLSTLKDEVLVNFKKTLEFLVSNKYDEDKIVKTISKLSILSINDLYFESPRIYTFCNKLSKIETGTIPRYTFILFFKSFCYQIFVPFCSGDNFILDDNIKIVMPIYPPYIANKEYSEYKILYEYHHEFKDLASSAQERKEIDEFYIINHSELIILKHSASEWKNIQSKFNLKH